MADEEAVVSPADYGDIDTGRELEDYERIYVACRNFILYTQAREWYPSQRRLALRIVKSLIRNEGEEIVCEMSRQTGKSTLLGDLVYAMMCLLPPLKLFPNGIRIGCFGPKIEQAGIVYRKIKENIDNLREENQKMKESLGINVLTANGKRIIFDNGASVICESASDNASIEGLTLDLAILDEAQGISETKTLKSIFPMLAATNGTKVLIGTPNFEIGYFYKAVQRHIGKDTCVIVPYQIAIRERAYMWGKTKNRFHLSYRQFIKKMKRQMGEDSDAFRTQFKLEWITERTRAITADKLESLAEVEIQENGLVSYRTYAPVLQSDSPVFVGIDIAKVVDATVVTVVGHYSPIDGKEYPNKAFIYSWLYLQGDNFEDQKEYIKAFLGHYTNIGSGASNRSVICWDDTGIGIPVGDWIKRNFHCQLIGLRLTAQINSDMYGLALQELNNDRVHYPIEKDTAELRQFIKEWIGLEKEYKGNLLKCESDKDDKYAHDDFCLSEDTKILTRRGFVGIDEMLDDDDVAAWDNGTISYEKPSRIIRKNHNGKMIRFSGEHFSALVTPEHKMAYYAKTKAGRVLRSRPAADFLGLSSIPANLPFPVAGIQSGTGLPIGNDEIALAGWMICEGWISQSKKRGWNDHRYSIGQSITANPSKVEEIQGIIDRLGIGHGRCQRKDGVVIWQFYKAWKPFFDRLLPDGVHRIPRQMLSELSYEQLKLLFDTMMKGDGTISRMTYSTCDSGLKDDFVELCSRIGHGTKTAWAANRRRGIYSIYIQKVGPKFVQLVSEIDYAGRVWCVTVPSGFIVTKRNDDVAVVGNCDSLCFALYAAYQPGSSRYLYVGALNELLDPKKRAPDGEQAKPSQGDDKRPRSGWWTGDGDKPDFGSWYDTPTPSELFGADGKRKRVGPGRDGEAAL